jgi:hypothetical protein
MVNSSLGNHTFTPFKTLTFEDAHSLKNDFYNHMNETGEIRIRPPNKIESSENTFINKLNSTMPKYYNIEYTEKYKGISWLLRISNNSPKFFNSAADEDKPCSIKAKINPKVFTGIKDYVSAANAGYLKDVETLFNIEALKISPILGEFSSYGLNRNDYCINFDLQELNIGCTPEQMIELMKRSYCPEWFTEWTKYDKDSHRKKSNKDSLYLKNNSVNINCYLKYKELCEDFIDCPSLENSRFVIRFEVQCKYSKIYSMSKIIRNNSGASNVINEILSDDVSSDIINKYFNRIIQKGGYYTLEMARNIVGLQHFKLKKEKRLIDTLNQINECRGISKAKDNLQDGELEDFRRTLRELAEIGVNPVTIPREWGIKQIQNLMDAYYRKIEDEHAKKQADERSLEIVQDFYRCV